jgi:hypothetical protein
MIQKILALCSRDQSHPAMYPGLEHALTRFQEQGETGQKKAPWSLLINEAEKQGVAPLLFKHIRSLDNRILPKSSLRDLQSLFLRNRRANTIRSREMAVVLDAFAGENIPVMVVKGIALANFAYTDPGLRSMRDIDLLVSENSLDMAQKILLDLGYSPEKEHDIPDDYYHLVPMQQTVDGLQVTLEVHHNLLPFTGQYPPWPLEKSIATALEFELDGSTAHTLNLEETLWYVYLHGFQAPLSYEPFRFVHVADLITLVERFADTIDWQRVSLENPTLLNVLSCLHQLTPFSDKVVSQLHLTGNRRPRAVGQPYRGWPLRTADSIPALAQLLLDTFWPGQWWLQIYYGQLTGYNYLKVRMFYHPRMVWRWFKAFRFLAASRSQQTD